MNYGEVLRRSWEIVWKHKVLWIFGILASCGSGGGGGGNSGFRISSRGELPPRAEQFFERTFGQFSDWQIAMIVLAIIVFLLLLAVIFIFLGTMGRIGLIKGTLEAQAGAETLAFGTLFSDGLRYFWRLFGLNLLVGLAVVAAWILIGLMVVAGAIVTLGIGLVCLIPLICLLVPVTWLVQVVLEQANVALVVEDLGILEALQRGWSVFREHIGEMIVMALILVLGAALVSLVIAAPVVAVVLPAVIGFMAGTDRALGGGLLLAGLCFVAYLPVLLVLSGILRAFVGSAWTLTFLELSGAPSEALVEA